MSKKSRIVLFDKIKEYVRKNKRQFIIMGVASFIGAMYVSGGITQSLLLLQKKVPSISFNPIYMMFYSLASLSYIIRTLIFQLLIFGLLLYYQILVRKQNKDDRNFVQSSSGAHGTSGFMNSFPEEMENCLEKGKVEEITEDIFGVDLEKDDILYSVNQQTNFRLNGHKLISGSSGSRKSRSQFIPNIFQTIKRGESMCITDPKGELYSITSALAKNHGYDVRVLNLKDPLNSDSCDFLKVVNGDTIMAQIFADVIMQNTSNGEKADFWSKSEQGYIVFGILAVDMDEGRPHEQKNLYEVYRFLTENKIEQLKAFANSLPTTHPARRAWSAFDEAPDNVQMSIKIGLGIRLGLLQDRKIQEITSHDEIDLVAPGKKKCAYYIITDDQSRALNFIASLFYSLLFKKLVDYADKRSTQRTKVPVRFILEEFPSTVKIPDFSMKMSTIRSRGLTCTICVQDNGQLEDMYPGNEFKNIMSNCGIAILLGTNDHIDSTKYWSDRAGVITIEKETRASEQTLFTNVFNRVRYKESKSEAERMLMTKDEIGRLDPNIALIFIDRERPLKLRKFDYSNHPYNKEVVKTKAAEHQPKWWSYFQSPDASAEDRKWFQRQLEILHEQLELSNDEDEEEAPAKPMKANSSKKGNEKKKSNGFKESAKKKARYFFEKVLETVEEEEEETPNLESERMVDSQLSNFGVIEKPEVQVQKEENIGYTLNEADLQQYETNLSHFADQEVQNHVTQQHERVQEEKVQAAPSPVKEVAFNLEEHLAKMQKAEEEKRRIEEEERILHERENKGKHNKETMVYKTVQVEESKEGTTVVLTEEEPPVFHRTAQQTERRKRKLNTNKI